MKRLPYFLMFIFLADILFSQSKIMPSINRHMYDLNIVDSRNVRISYALNAVDINDTKTYDDLQRLEIGSKISKYYSYFVFRNDSLIREFRKKNPKIQGIPHKLGEFGKKEDTWSLVIWSDYFKDFSKNTLTVYANMPHSTIPSYQYTERVPLQEWALQEDTLTICGYLCQKATCRFRGRDFVAWFAADIPVSNGPWKFGGLPGLILKVYDIDKHYVFECIKIENHNTKFPIIMLDEKRYQKTERTKLRKLEKDIHEDFFKVGGLTVTTKDGSPAKFIPIPYHPIELE